MTGPAPSTPPRRRRASRVACAGAVALGATLWAACGGGTSGGSALDRASTNLTSDQLGEGAGHACVPGGQRRADVAWSGLANPVFSDANGAAKDQAIVWSGGTWHLLFSYVTLDPSEPGGVRWDIASATSPDWPRAAVITGLGILGAVLGGLLLRRRDQQSE